MKKLPSRPGRQRGIAVITAILIAAIVASLAFALSARERQWLNLVGNRNDLHAAQSTALSALDLMRLTLRDDMRNSQLDHLLETWTVPIPPVDVDEGKVSGRLIELQGRFNLYTVQSGGKVSQTGVVALQRLLATRNLPTQWADKLALAMTMQVAALTPAQLAGGTADPSSATTPGRTAAPGSPAKPGPAASATAQAVSGMLLPVVSLSELAELAGIEAEKLAPLEPLVVLLPEATNVNVNFAPPEVLMAVTPGLSLKDAEQLVNRRAAAFFKSPQEFINALPEGEGASTRADIYTVESQYFLAEAESWFGRAHLRLQALVFRQRGQMPETLWLRRS